MIDQSASLATETAADSQLNRMLAMAAGNSALRTAIVHPKDAVSISSTLEAARLGLIEPVLIGSRTKIEAAAVEACESLSGIELLDVEHSHAAASEACRLARKGAVSAIMKGSLHTDELLEAVVDRNSGLRTDRRMSHIFILDVASYPRPIFLSDAAINIAPDLAAKKDIVQNAIDCAIALGVTEPRVAVLAAVETVHPSMSATLDAAALSKMADRGQIVGGVVDGPLAFDNAISPAAATAKSIESDVAGRADILVAPSIEAGNMMAKQLTYLAGAQSAGIAIGARVPIILTSRADGRQSRLASCAAAVLYSRHKKLKPTR